MQTGKPQDRAIQVFMSTYNGEKYLSQQLDSILSQADVAIKVLVRDDGSTDGTREILRAYRDSHGIEVLQGENIGVTRSYYAMFEQRDRACPYYAISDQDDVWVRDKCALALDAFAQMDPMLPALYASRSRVVAEDLSPIGYTESAPRGPSFYNAMVQNIGAGHTQVLNRALMDRVAEMYAEEILVVDWWIYLIASALGEVFFDETPTVLHRQHGKNVIGYEHNGIKHFMMRVRRHLRGRPTDMCLQIQALHPLLEDMAPEKRREVEGFMGSQGSLFRRIGYARKTKCYRQVSFENVLFKALYVLGSYKV